MRESQHKRLTRSGSDRMIAGVFGGIGQYFKIQPNILRILYVLLTIFTYDRWQKARDFSHGMNAT